MRQRTRPSEAVSRHRVDAGLFDLRPITLAGFTLGASSVTAVGRPTVTQWGAAMDFATACEQSSPFWLGALWNYAQERQEWKDSLYQALGRISHPIQLKTLENHGLIARKVTAKAKALAPSIGHADAVTALPPDEQVAWMEKADTEGLTVHELRRAIRVSKAQQVLEGQAPTMHTIDVTVRLSLEGETANLAEQAAWNQVKAAVSGIAHAHVISAHALERR